MRSIVMLLFLVCALPACKTTRTVVAGPKTTSLDINDYDPQAEANSAEIGRKAAASGMVGSQFGGGRGWSQRFGDVNPYGYELNAMNEKIYGGDTGTKDMKSFTQTKDFLTKRYTNTSELEQKESYTQRMKSWLGGKKANTDKLARETSREYGGETRVLENKTSYSDGRTVKERSSREDGRVAGTKDYYPAQKAIDRGADAPKIIGQGDKKTNDSVWKLIKSRPRDDPATVEDIRQLLGKSE
jgi:hypothetical protein